MKRFCDSCKYYVGSVVAVDYIIGPILILHVIPKPCYFANPATAYRATFVPSWSVWIPFVWWTWWL